MLPLSIDSIRLHSYSATVDNRNAVTLASFRKNIRRGGYFESRHSCTEPKEAAYPVTVFNAKNNLKKIPIG
jgi:hypothetical protein